MTFDPELSDPPRRGRGRPPRDPSARPGDPGVIGGRSAESLSLAILDSLPALVAVIEHDGRVIAVNKAWERFAQDAADEFPHAPALGGNYLDALSDGRSFEAARGSEALAGLQLVLDRERGRFEVEYPVTVRGEERWFLLTVTPLLGAEGGAALSHLEATDRKRAEQETAEQHRMLAAVLESTAEGVVVADRNGDFTLFNRAARELAGVGLVDGDPARWNANFGLFHPDRVTLMQLDELPLTRAIQGESTDGVRMFVRNPAIPSGRYLEVSGRPWTTPEGDRRGGVVVFGDVTAQVLAEERSRLRGQVLDAVPLAVVALDRTGELVYWNDAAEQLFGWSARDLAGRDGLEVLLGGDDGKRSQLDVIRAGLLAGRPFRGEFTVRRNDGTDVPVLASAMARRRTDGTLDGYVIAGVDLTGVHVPSGAVGVDAAARAAEAPTAAAPAPASPLPITSATLLLVDSEPGVRDITRRMLEGSGHLVLEAPHGEGALELVRAYTGAIDLVVCADRPGGMRGADLVEAVRALRPGVRALFLSGYGTDAASRPLFGQASLAKPFSVAQLDDAVRRALDGPSPEAR